MPVRNAAPYLAEAIGSILAQTHTDFELVILDDASTDESPAIAARFACRDARIRVSRSDAPLGLAESYNQVVARARA